MVRASVLVHQPTRAFANLKWESVVNGDEQTQNLAGPSGLTDDNGLPISMPLIGEVVFGCEIEEKIGQGGFGSVYLAKQLGLANRPVVLKLTLGFTQEPERLAGLQHAHVVPILSVGSHGPFQVLCMPYYGRQTLADVLVSIERTHTLPATGGGLLSTRVQARDTTKENAEPWRKTVPQKDPNTRPQPARELLTRLSFPESLVWVFARLAEGLAHAHENGILHLDLKPQNILITDSGVPMILDFGQAYDINCTRSAAPTGGTVRYMPTEQLISFEDKKFVPDARMDLYALGVMMYELLTGRHPYPETLRPGRTLRQILQGRREAARSACAYNAAISPALGAILSKLIHPELAKRYQSADELVEDLNRQQKNQALAFAGNPSLIERANKFRRRNPVLAMCLLASLLAVGALGATGVAIQQAQQKEAAQAVIQAEEIHQSLTDFRIELTSPTGIRKRNDSLQKASNVFQQYEVATNPKWLENPAISRLTPKPRERLLNELGELAMLCAMAERNNAANRNADYSDPAYLRAVSWNRLALLAYADQPLPMVLKEQRIALAKETQNPKLGEELDGKTFGAESSVDYFIRSLMQRANLKHREAIATMEQLVELEPWHAAGQLILGMYYQNQGRLADASERFLLAKVLAPKDPQPCFNRGNLLYIQNHYAEAIAEYNTAIRRDPKASMVYYQRGLVYARIHREEEAHADMLKAAEDSSFAFRAYLFQAQLHSRNGKTEEARAARLKASNQKPQDEIDYVARGIDRISTKEFVDAYADFCKATTLNNAYMNGWNNQAHVLSEHLKQPEKAIDALDQVLKLVPDYAPALSSKAVLLARLGLRDDAMQVIRKAIAVSEECRVSYQAACVYALMANADHPEDLEQAVVHFRQALRSGFQDFATIDDDTDIDSIRKRKDFLSALQAAKELHKK